MELAPSNPQESLQVAVQDLARAMEIGLYLVDNEILSSVRGKLREKVTINFVSLNLQYCVNSTQNIDHESENT